MRETREGVRWGVFLGVFLIRSVCLLLREAIKGGLMALRNVIPGGDTFMNLGLEMVRDVYTVAANIYWGFICSVMAS